MSLPSSGESFRSVLPHAVSACLAAPLDVVDKVLLDRPLQPTLDTSTRGTLDFRARGLRRTNRRVPPRPRSGSPVRRQTVLRRSSPG
jgi:hypothetical protein